MVISRPVKVAFSWGCTVALKITRATFFEVKYKRQPGADDQRGPVYAPTQPIDAYGIKACIPSIG